MSAVDLDALIADLRTPIRAGHEEKPNHVLRRANISRMDAAKALDAFRRAPASALDARESPSDAQQAGLMIADAHQAPASAGKVKALPEWLEARKGTMRYLSCITVAGDYLIALRGDADFLLSASHQSGWTRYQTLEAAKSAAQADYEDRILSAFEPGDGWRPIETAPKDGAWILSTGQSWNGDCEIVGWHFGAWRTSADPISIIICPTHWWPLPAPPAQGEARE